MLKEKIEEALDKVRPALQADGGDVQFVDVSFGYNIDDLNDGGKDDGEMAKPPENMAQKMMEQNPMMKRAFEMIKTFPEPHSSFILKNMMQMPQEIRMKLMMKFLI